MTQTESTISPPTTDVPSAQVLGIDDEKLIGLVRDPDLLEEIARVREAEGCL